MSLIEASVQLARSGTAESLGRLTPGSASEAEEPHTTGGKSTGVRSKHHPEIQHTENLIADKLHGHHHGAHRQNQTHIGLDLVDHHWHNINSHQISEHHHSFSHHHHSLSHHPHPVLRSRSSSRGVVRGFGSQSLRFWHDESSESKLHHRESLLRNASNANSIN